MSFENKRKIHFVGIGGAGMSAIAKVLLERGLSVSGSDLKRSGAIGVLEATGASVSIGHDASNVAGADLVVISAAIPETNPEVVAAREAGIEVITRGRALALVLEGTDAVIVAGTHGKTTTTSMIVSILLDGGSDPTYLIGGGLNDSGTNARHGTSRLSVAESDESDGSFLLLEPHVAVVTNVEADHLDHWGSFDAIVDAFDRWLGHVDDDGTIVVPAANHHLVDAARGTGRRILTFGAGGDVAARDVAFDVSGARFELVAEGDSYPVVLKVRGAQIVSNALAAASACLAAGMSLESVARGLGGYRGVERRFQRRGEAAGVVVIDDYAHHPTEIKAVLAASRPGPWRRVVAVFQPHRYSRTQAFFEEFGDSFAGADRIVITDVFGAGEPPRPGITGKLVSDSVAKHLPGRSVAYLPHRDEVLDYLAVNLRPGDMVLTLGAGDVSAYGDELLSRLKAAEG